MIRFDDRVAIAAGTVQWFDRSYAFALVDCGAEKGAQLDPDMNAPGLSTWKEDRWDDLMRIMTDAGITVQNSPERTYAGDVFAAIQDAAEPPTKSITCLFCGHQLRHKEHETLRDSGRSPHTLECEHDFVRHVAKNLDIAFSANIGRMEQLACLSRVLFASQAASA